MKMEHIPQTHSLLPRMGGFRMPVRATAPQGHNNVHTSDQNDKT